MRNLGRKSSIVRLGLLAALLLVGMGVVGCSDEKVYPVTNGYAPPPNGYPQNPGGPGFNPQLPPGQPNSYYPFLPIDGFMQQTPGLYQYWQQTWQDWTYYSYYYGYDQYDFTSFWYDYCPQVWNNTSYQPIYQYMDQYFYSWMTPQTQFDYSVDANYFWSYYEQYPYYSWGGCSDYCY